MEEAEDRQEVEDLEALVEEEEDHQEEVDLGVVEQEGVIVEEEVLQEELDLGVVEPEVVEGVEVEVTVVEEGAEGSEEALVREATVEAVGQEVSEEEGVDNIRQVRQEAEAVVAGVVTVGVVAAEEEAVAEMSSLLCHKPTILTKEMDLSRTGKCRLISVHNMYK